MRTWPAVLAALIVVAVAAPVATSSTTASVCGTPDAPLVLTGSVTEADAKQYRHLPVVVPDGTENVTVSYRWRDGGTLPGTPLTASTIDLGLWDEDGYLEAEGFRGWSGSRQSEAFVQADAATRGYRRGPIEPGTWWVELGIAAVGPGGASWTVEVRCGPARTTFPDAQLPHGAFDDAFIARDEPGWYHGDLHMHGYHSHRNGPDWDGVVEQAVAAGLDFLPITDYVTDAHWAELGPAQAAHPDVLLWPGREIITYFGHANALGITDGVVEYRHGLGDITLGGIQRDVKEAGGLFQVNHPTIFPGPLFANFCRGCEFTLGDTIDWSQVDTIEVLTGPVLADPSDAGGPGTAPLAAENPFMDAAIELWERLLGEGHKIAPVSGSDSKGVEPAGPERARKGYGSSATAVYAENLSIAALRDAIAAGHVYVRTRGVHGSPALAMEAVTADGQRGTFGDVLSADTATLSVTVDGGAGQLLRVIANGTPVATIPIAQDHAVLELPIARIPASEGPLGTFWRVETLDAQSRTTVGNAVFLQPAD